MRRIVSIILILALIFPATVVNAAILPTVNFKISGFSGASISVYDSNNERIMYTEDGPPKSRYIEPGTNLKIEWEVNDDIEHMVLINDVIYTGSKTETSLITPKAGELYEFDLINQAEVDAIIEINEPRVTIKPGRPSQCNISKVPEHLAGRINLSSPIIEIAYKITRNGEIVAQEILPATDEWKIDNPDFDGSNNLLQITVLTVDGKEYKKLVNISLNDVNDEFDENDDDGDGLANGVEDRINTDKAKPDTDEDGLTDYEEMNRTLTNPTMPDTDKNGVNDGDEDFDNDSITNIEECFYGTNPYVSDTDGDGINDFDEIKKYFSNPLWIDTDNDGLLDGLEINYKMDINNPDTLGDGIKDGNRKFNVVISNNDAFSEYGIRPTVLMELKGTQINTLSIQKVSIDDIFLSAEVPGFIGNAFDFNIDGSFDTATLTFEFPEALLSDAEFEPAIYYFDEEEQLLIELENQTIEGNRVSAPVEHFSQYMLLNKEIHSEVWEYEFKFDEDSTETFKNLDVAFVIDSSGSMASNDKAGIRKTVTNNFVDKLTADDKAAIIDFDSYATLYSAFTSDKTALKAAVSRIDSSGGTNLTNGISMAINQFTASEYVNNNALKVIIMLTDGQGAYNTALTQKAADNNIIIYSVGLGSGTNAQLLKNMAEGTTGNYYHASDADKLYTIFDKIADESDFAKDSDSDGINDYFEKEINQERLRLGSGVSLLGLDYLNADTDGDSLDDGNEIHVVKSGTKVYVKMYSNPMQEDTDEDGILDALDPEKLSYTITDRTLALVSGLSYSNLESYVGKTIGEIADMDVEFKGLSDTYAKEIKNAVLIFSNESGTGWWGDSDWGDRGLGSVAIEIKRSGKPNAVIYGLRGTEPGDDTIYDGLTDLVLAIGPSSVQSDIAFNDYVTIAHSKSKEYYISGHSLGGRLTQDAIYKIYNSNEGFLGASKTDIPTPKYSATFNGLGYNRLVYTALENDIIAQYKNTLHNYYFESDFVGHSLGANPYGISQRTGTDIGPWRATYEDGTEIPVNPIIYEMSKVHGISLFYWNSKMFYPRIPSRN